MTLERFEHDEQLEYERKIVASAHRALTYARRGIYMGDGEHLKRLGMRVNKGRHVLIGRYWTVGGGEYYFWPEGTKLSALTIYRVLKENIADIS